MDDNPPKLYVVDNINLEIRPSDLEGAGNGLFALRDFAVGDPITEYYGQKITFNEAINRRDRGDNSHIRSHIQRYWAIDGKFLADGTRIVDPARQLQGNGGGALANHKSKKLANARYDFFDTPANETRFEQWAAGNRSVRLLPEDRITYLTATKPIKAGDEIFVNYGTDYWKGQIKDPLIE